MNRRSGDRSPSECRQRVKSSDPASASSATAPTRVIMRMFRTTYRLSVISTPTFENREPGGPIRNGTTYIVRPAIAPANSGVSFARASSGAIQLLVGPASSLLVGADEREVLGASDVVRWRFDGGTQPGKSSWLSAMSSPLASPSDVRAARSASDPSQTTTRSGAVSARISSTQRSMKALPVGMNMMTPAHYRSQNAGAGTNWRVAWRYRWAVCAGW